MPTVLSPGASRLRTWLKACGLPTHLPTTCLLCGQWQAQPLCQACIEPVKATYLRIGKPRSLRAAGVIFFGTPYRMGAQLPVPEKTKTDAELWITMEGWDGSMHQGSIPLSQASPATSAWLNKQGVKP